MSGLADIARTAAGKALKQLLAPSKQAKLGDLVAAIAEASPYLWDLIRLDPARFLGILECRTRGPLRGSLLAEARRAAEAASEADAMRVLRRAKAEAALLIALADIGGVWPVDARRRAR